ncbi:uncharacterized protein HD556DRAFT_1436166 [Suillus plorans]|uniref:Uncharacterized protein n=1 Tax=Suillus plorans TaxID=116603 RepID=A0A9P7JA67_9AGAM|nr:uncharacterized protein HD556DRAFT_1436166 [Suillus plorans]KAG1810424.1 hypothetical protein HD556DRAFT_1436166 [Suillus plorans]
MSGDAGAALANEITQLSFDLRNAYDDVVSRSACSLIFLGFFYLHRFQTFRGQLKEVQLSSSMLAEISESSFKFQSFVKQFGSSDHQNEFVNILCKL